MRLREAHDTRDGAHSPGTCGACDRARESQRKYERSKKGRATQARYNRSIKNRIRQNAYQLRKLEAKWKELHGTAEGED